MELRINRVRIKRSRPVVAFLRCLNENKGEIDTGDIICN